MFCHNCGKQIPDNTKFCHYCGAAQRTFASDEQPAPEQPVRPQPTPYQSAVQPGAVQEQERVLAGIFGALLCSLAGVAVMFILFKMDFVASLTGIIMLVCTAWGYAHFGKVLSKKGVFFSILIVIVMIFVGNQLCWADYIHSNVDPGTPVTWWFLHLNDLIGIGPLRNIEDAYYECLTKQYAFAAVGVIFLAVNLFRGNRAAKKK